MLCLVLLLFSIKRHQQTVPRCISEAWPHVAAVMSSLKEGSPHRALPVLPSGLCRARPHNFLPGNRARKELLQFPLELTKGALSTLAGRNRLTETNRSQALPQHSPLALTHAPTQLAPCHVSISCEAARFLQVHQVPQCIPLFPWHLRISPSPPTFPTHGTQWECSDSPTHWPAPFSGFTLAK